MTRQQLVFLALVFATTSLAAQEFATERDAKQLIDSVSKNLSTDFEKAIQEINETNSRWMRGDLYPTVVKLDGIMLANSARLLLVGKNVYNLKDPNGKLFVKEYIDLAASNGESETNFRVTDPVTKSIMQRTLFCKKQTVKIGDVIVCSGIFRR